jgi:hypothetical protein
MTVYDVTPDDEPLDIAAVNADDALIERLRHALSPDTVVSLTDEGDSMDPGYALLRALQLDVSADLPTETIVPAGVTELLPRRRHLSRTATMAVVAAGVLSIGGVAAASAPGLPLAGARHAVSNAVASAVDAITPDSPVGPTRPTLTAPTTIPSLKPTPPGDAVSDAARSASAILQIEANLDKAAAFLDEGRYEPAKAQLDAAARKLGYVTDAGEHARLGARLHELQTRLAATPHATPSTGRPDGKGKPTAHPSPGSGHANGNAVEPSHKPTALPTTANEHANGHLVGNSAPHADTFMRGHRYGRDPG